MLRISSVLEISSHIIADGRGRASVAGGKLHGDAIKSDIQEPLDEMTPRNY